MRPVLLLALASAVSALVLVACIDTQAVDLANKECPCATGWMCDDSQSPPVCVRGAGGGAGPTDGGGGDAGDAGDPGDGGGLMDGGPGGMDTGMMMDDHIRIEAESGMPVAPLEVRMDDAMASGNAYITVAAMPPAQSGAPNEDPAGRATYTVSIPTAGMYKIWGRIIAPTTSNDSFWVRVDGGMWWQWNNLSVNTAWAWDDVHHSVAMMPDMLQTPMLTAGDHTIDIEYREEGAQLDKLLITSDLAYTPTGPGG